MSQRTKTARRLLLAGSGAALVISLFTIVQTGGAGASPAYPSVDQTAQTVGPLNPTNIQALTISCPSVTTCFEIGTIGGTSDGELPWIGTLSDGSWTFMDGPVPSDASTVDAGVQVSALTCFSATTCVAIGTYQDLNNVQQGLLLSLTDGSWVATQAPVPSDAATDNEVTDNTEHTYVKAVSCWAEGSCMAVGTYMVDATARYAGMALQLTNGTWSTTKLTPPANAVQTESDDVTTVSCDPTGICVAGGQYPQSGAAFEVVQLLTNASGSWTSSEPDGLPGSPSYVPVTVSAIDCPAVNQCTAVGNYYESDISHLSAMVLQQSTSGWSGVVVPIPGDTGTAVTVGALSCAAVGSCVADGTFQSGPPGGGEPFSYGFILQESSDGWTAQEAPMPVDQNVGSPGISLGSGSLSCPAVGECTAVGTYDTQPSTNTQIGDAGMVLTQSNGTWVVATQQGWPQGYTPGVPNNVVAGELFQVSCATPGSCWANGFVKDIDADTGPTEQFDVESISTTRPAVGTTTPTISLTPSSATVSVTDGGYATFQVTATGNATDGSPDDPVSVYVCGPTVIPTPCSTYSNPLGPVNLTPASASSATGISPAIQPHISEVSGYWCAAAYYYGDSNYGAATDLGTDGCFDLLPDVTSADSTTFTEGEAATPFQVTAGPDIAPITFSETGSLPSGVTLSSDGQLGGTPKAAGTFPITINAADTTGHSTEQTFTLSVAPGSALQVATTSPLPPAQAGAVYTDGLTTTGGTSPYKWKLIKSKLPKGLKLGKKTGTISGKPRASGADTFEVQVTSGSQTADATLSITVT
jgi:hypothetical protein